MFKKLFTIFLLPLIFGFLGAVVYVNYGQSWLRLARGNPGDNTVTVVQNSEGAVFKVSEESGTIDIVKSVSPSVVSIIIKKDINTVARQPYVYDPFDFFGLGPQTVPEQSSEPNIQKVGGGTGFIISSDGYIVTNKHVISDDKAEYSVSMNDGAEYPTKVIGTDLFNDIGVLKIEAKDLPVVKLGDSDQLQVGQTVIAIGNALAEFSNTVTKGVVSGKGRSIVAGAGGTSERLEDVIQTDAAINPGNSGGPLLNLAGEVIGVNTAISQQGQLIGFAIPINSVKSLISGVIEKGRIVRPYLGVRYQLIDADLAQRNNVSVDYGALIIRGSTAVDLAVIPGSPADKAGLKENDIILSVDGQKITAENSLAEIVSSHTHGQTLSLEILSQGNKRAVSITLEEYKSR